MANDLETRLRGAWEGRVSGCMLGKALEAYSMTTGHEKVTEYLDGVDALPLRDYVPLAEDAPELLLKGCCHGQFAMSAPDDDINYSVLALEMLESHGAKLSTVDVARAWMNKLPVGMTFTAERAAYRTLLMESHEWFSMGAEPGFDLAECADNEFSDWIGAQIRADVYGWVSAGNLDLAARLVTADASLSHRGDGVYGAVIVSTWGAAIPGSPSLEAALDRALPFIPDNSGAAKAVELGRNLANSGSGPKEIQATYGELSPVHTNNNLALVVWALLSHPDDFSAAIGDVVAAGWDTDCNGATVGGLWGLQGKPVPSAWTTPWSGRVKVSLAGQDEWSIESLVERTVRVANALAGEKPSDATI